MRITTSLQLVSLSFILACQEPETTAQNNGGSNKPASDLAFDVNDGSLLLPEDFRAVVVADDLGKARHLAVRANGDIYVNLGQAQGGKGVLALHDNDGDGIADSIVPFGRGAGTAIKFHNGYLYYATNTQIIRHQFNGEELVPEGPEEVVLNLPAQNQHAAKALAFDGKGNMYVSIGAPSNACQNPGRTPGVKGQDPCPLLESHGGIWQFSDDQLGQQLSDGQHYATGIRHAVAMDWGEEYDQLFAMQHGRDQLHELWPNLYTEAESAELPAEELLAIELGDDFGWPYCYYDQKKGKKVLGPEYGGDGDKVGRCSNAKDPLLGFPGHWAPNGMAFSASGNFPARFGQGLFIAFHGSWNRAPLPQQGYKVVYVPMKDAKPDGQYLTFADQFAGDGDPPAYPGEAEYRPCGVAFGPDGSLYICDDVKGRLWRIVYTGS